MIVVDLSNFDMHTNVVTSRISGFDLLDALVDLRTYILHIIN